MLNSSLDALAKIHRLDRSAVARTPNITTEEIVDAMGGDREGNNFIFPAPQLQVQASKRIQLKTKQKRWMMNRWREMLR